MYIFIFIFCILLTLVYSFSTKFSSKRSDNLTEDEIFEEFIMYDQTKK